MFASVLLGVSFGGILVQEMSKYMTLKKLFVVSSVKSHHELPKRLKLLKYAKAYKILPTQLVSNVDLLAKFAFGETIKKRLKLYKKYLSVILFYLLFGLNAQSEDPIDIWNIEET